ncbi:MAG: substrate-binding domain-containing protein [Actinomycetia bacterium]|nr:substrate-binding domain-containing protein [Actinomycetes bacterium]
MNKSTGRLVIASIAGLSLFAAACGDDEGAKEEATTTVEAVDTTTGADETTTTVEEVAGGEVFVTGSSTVEPIAVLVGELADANTGGALAVTVEGPGTGDGFKKFCAGEADVADASRHIKDEEAALCAEAGIDFIELEIGIDGLTVATSPNNDAVTCLDFPALYALIGPEAEGFTNWTDAQALATELGSTSEAFPDADLVITGPGPESGTYDSFIEIAFKKIAEGRGTDPKAARNDYTQSPNDNVIVEGIEGSDSSLGWVGFAFYEAEADRMKAIEIDKGDGCVAPTVDTIADGSYPLSRSLFMYVNAQKLAENPAIGAYVDLFLSEEGIAKVTEAGYVAIPADRLEASRTTWADATA